MENILDMPLDTLLRSSKYLLNLQRFFLFICFLKKKDCWLAHADILVFWTIGERARRFGLRKRAPRAISCVHNCHHTTTSPPGRIRS
jgi:hypothetical protein